MKGKEVRDILFHFNQNSLLSALKKLIINMHKKCMYLIFYILSFHRPQGQSV